MLRVQIRALTSAATLGNLFDGGHVAAVEAHAGGLIAAKTAKVFFRQTHSPRGEGERFAQKVRARMIGAIEQSGGAWLPDIALELSLADALVRSGDTDRACFLLERGGRPLLEQRPGAADLLLGPEGGIEPSERALIVEEHGWLPASLAETTLRFETAGVVAAGVLRALMTRA